jgi:Protein of unknown function (DUF4238)
MTTPRKHHYLPQFYLRGFSPDGTKITQIEKATGRGYSANIKDTAAIRDFHEIDSDSVDDRFALERKLAEIEGTLASYLREFLRDGFGNEQAYAETLGLLSMLRVRVPAMKTHIESFHREYIRSTGKVLQAAGKIPPPPAGLEEALNFDNLDISVTNWKCLEHMFQMSGDPKLMSILCGMRATLYRPPLGCGFVTSDQPVALFHPTINRSSPIGAGPAMPGVEITLPLTNSHLLMLDHKNGPNSIEIASLPEVAEFNRRTIIMTTSYIFAKYNTSQIASLVEQNKDKSAGHTFDTTQDGESFYQLHRFIPVSPQHSEDEAKTY